LNVLTPDIIGDTIDMISSLAGGSGTGISRGASGVVLVPLSEWVANIMSWDQGMTRLGVYCFSLIFIAASTGLLNFTGRYAAAWTSQKACFDLRGDMYNSLMEQSFSFYDNSAPDS